MDCDRTIDRMAALQHGTLDEFEQLQLAAHLDACEDCRLAARAAAALRRHREDAAFEVPAGVFERVMRRSRRAGEAAAPRSRFWIGAGVGAAVAASLAVAVFSTGLLEPAMRSPAAAPAFAITRGAPRIVNIAIEMERDLPGAVITVALSGGIELDGYAGQRELSWTADLEAGINRLTLPIVAVEDARGRLLVRVQHGGKERHFTMDLELES